MLVPAGAEVPVGTADKPKGVPESRPLPLGRGGASLGIRAFWGGVGAFEDGPLAGSIFFAFMSISDRACEGRVGLSIDDEDRTDANGAPPDCL